MECLAGLATNIFPAVITAPVWAGRRNYHSLTGRDGSETGPVTENKLTEVFRPSVTCLTSLGSVARIPARNYLHILATVKSIL